MWLLVLLARQDHLRRWIGFGTPTPPTLPSTMTTVDASLATSCRTFLANAPMRRPKERPRMMDRQGGRLEIRIDCRWR